MNIKICIGSSCHLKGSRQVVEQLQELIAENDLKDEIELSATFCMENCTKGVSVTLDDELHSLTPEGTSDFFNRNILKRLVK